MNWIIKSQHKNADKRIIALELADEDGSFEAQVRWDGCMEIHIRSRTEEGVELTDTIHTCDLDGLIAKLQGLKQACRDLFADPTDQAGPMDQAGEDGHVGPQGPDSPEPPVPPNSVI